MLDWRIVRARRFIIAAIVAICIGGPIIEMFDWWDQTAQDGNDTEANVMIVALCVGVALSVAGAIGARIRALSSVGLRHALASVSRHCSTTPSFDTPLPSSSPPTALRI